MRKEALIHVVGTQNYSEGLDDRMDFITTGTYHKRDNAYYIIYHESEITGMEGVTTSLKVEAEKLTLNRMGAANYKQVFERGVLHHSTYITSMGSFYLGAQTEELEMRLTEYGGHITLKYNLYADNDLISRNTLRIMIKEDTPR